MDPGDQSVTLEHFMTWKVEALREFLTKRGLSKDGNKSELAALCYSSHVMKLPIIPSTADILQQNQLDYNSLLTVDNFTCTIPDPFSLHKDWFDEKCGIAKWPPIYLSDIISYLSDSTSKENIKSVLQEYKIGKAYEYFHNGFLQEVFYHNINSMSPFCILRSRCTPSMCFKDGYHNIWICARQDSGEIMSSYCSCTAGLGGTCNHVTALLFRVESANKQGLTSCTSVPCTWSIPPRTKEIVPSKIKDLNVEKSRHGQSDQKRPLVSEIKRDFHPMDLSKAKVNTSDFIDVIRKTLPNACILKGLSVNNQAQSRSQAPPDIQNLSIDQSPPVTESSHLSRYCMDEVMDHCQTISSDSSDVMKALPEYSEKDQEKIHLLTIGQSSCSSWHEIRRGRITASNFYSIHTKVKSFKANKVVDFSPNVAKIMGYEHINPNIKSLKHGREMEPIAKASHKSYISSKVCNHVNVHVSECGVFVDKKHPYLAASPDLLVSCDCCGKGLVEIKCPLIPKCMSCNSFCFCNMPSYLTKDKHNLKNNHSFYAQIQGQLAVTGRKYCDLYVYTCNGPLHQRIVYDEGYYTDVLDSLIYFFMNHVLPEFSSRKLKDTFQSTASCNTVEVDHSAMNVETTFFCPACSQVIENQSSVCSFKDQSICCDQCELWYHFRCVGMSKQLALKLKKKWSCKTCSDM